LQVKPVPAKFLIISWEDIPKLDTLPHLLVLPLHPIHW